MRMKPKHLNFKNLEAYRKWLAYGHMHKKFDVPGDQNILIHGKFHKVKHGR